MANQNVEEGKGIAIISYLSIVGTIIAYFLNNDKKNSFASFHIRQALGLWIMFPLLGFVTSYFDSWFATFGFYMFFGVLFIYGFINAIGGKEQEVPLVGAFFQKLFASIGN